MDRKKIASNKKLQKKFRTIGFILTGIGGICVVIGLIDFFSVMSSMSGAPKLFFLLFIGIPLVGGGAMCLNLGYMGALARYHASEVAPVASDTINYIVDETKDGIIDAVQSVKTGEGNYIICPKCSNKNDKDSKFCDKCGAALTKTCQYCAEENDGDAVFCKSCGKRI